jgi:hypothetical protein
MNRARINAYMQLHPVSQDTLASQHVPPDGSHVTNLERKSGPNDYNGPDGAVISAIRGTVRKSSPLTQGCPTGDMRPVRISICFAVIMLYSSTKQAKHLAVSTLARFFDLFHTLPKYEAPCEVVGIMMCSGLAGIQLPAGVRDLSLLHSVQTASCVHPASYPIGTGGKAVGT